MDEFAHVNIDNIHLNIKKKLDYFIKNKKVPNIIFHGESGSGKNHIVNDFIYKIYNGDKHYIQTYVMHVNCAHGKGIRFVREDLKFFSKTNVDLKDGEIFKTVILLNADKLTTDAQSAIRRCIELFSRSTRFFIIVEDKYKLLKPILSRFCEIYVSEPIINNRVTNLHTYFLNDVYTIPFKNYDGKHNTFLKAAVNNFIKKIKNETNENETNENETNENETNENETNENETNENETNENETSLTSISKLQECMTFIIKLYDKGYSSIDIMNFIEKSKNIEELKRFEYLTIFHKVKREFRNEKILMLFFLYFFIFRKELTLENIIFI
jgi:DNA polymerase III delta prime subunit